MICQIADLEVLYSDVQVASFDGRSNDALPIAAAQPEKRHLRSHTVGGKMPRATEPPSSKHRGRSLLLPSKCRSSGISQLGMVEL